MRRSDTVRAMKSPTMHTIHSMSGKRKVKRMGMADKGRSRDSSMGRTHAKARWSTR